MLLGSNHYYYMKTHLGALKHHFYNRKYYYGTRFVCIVLATF